MFEVKGDLWRIAAISEVNAVAITTNGFVKANRSAVLGKGCALEALKQWPAIAAILGARIKDYGLRVEEITCHDLYLSESSLPYSLVAFPVKPAQIVASEFNIVKHQRFHFPPGKVAPGWAAMAIPELIVKSSLQLVALIDANGWKKVLLPRPGCGAGALSWDEVKPLIAPILDDRVVIVSK